MLPNTQEIVGLFRDLGSKVDGAGEPILSVVKTVVTVTTERTFMRERKFDPTTGTEQGPLDHEIDVGALATSTQEAQEDLAVITTISDLVAAADPANPTKITKDIKDGAKPAPTPVVTQAPV